MAKKKSAPAAASKSAVIREILAAQPKAPNKQVKAKLEAKGVKASDALINKIKYDRKGAAGGKSRRGRRASGNSKAAAIRGMFDQLGLDARPRDVIAALKAKGITVTSAQVGALRGKLSTNGHGTAKIVTGKVVGDAVAYEHLLAAKQLAERLGGVEQARRALESFARLVDA